MGNLTARRPQQSIWDFMSEMERVFDDTWAPARATSTLATESFVPRVDVREGKDHYLIAADLPGLNRNQIKVECHQGRLSISGERSKEVKADNEQWHRVERTFGRFERTFQLPVDVKEEQIQARFEDGVLEVFVPKAQAAQARTISIEGEKKGLFSKLLGKEEKGEH